MSATYCVEIRITPRKGILDPEGETIARALDSLGYDGITSVRAGRLLRMDVDSETEADARRTVEKMCEELIANPVIEQYEILIGKDGTEQMGRNR